MKQNSLFGILTHNQLCWLVLVYHLVQCHLQPQNDSDHQTMASISFFLWHFQTSFFADIIYHFVTFTANSAYNHKRGKTYPSSQGYAIIFHEITSVFEQNYEGFLKERGKHERWERRGGGERKKKWWGYHQKELFVIFPKSFVI